MANSDSERREVEKRLEERFLRVFQGEVGRQCKFALIAVNDMEAAFKSGKSDSIDRFWYSVQAFLVCCGDISKLLWPNEKYDARGIGLRKSLGVDDDSPLRPRDFRNHFEHFDERLEDWITSSERHNIVDSSIFPKGLFVGIDEKDYLRNYHNDTGTVSFRGDEYHLVPLVKAIQDLLAKTGQADNRRRVRVPRLDSDKTEERVP